MEPIPDLSRALTALQRLTLDTAVCRVLPSSDGPGAREADVMAFIDWMIRQRVFDRRWRCFVVGLDLLEATARCKHGASFHACPAAIQDDLLGGLMTVPHPTIRRFFVTLIRLAVMGFLAPARYPGNRDRVGWQHVGYAGASTLR